MYKINDEIIENEKAYFDFANATLRLADDDKVVKFSPRIWVEGINKNNDELRFMIETSISDKELKSLKLNEEIELKPIKFGEDNDIGECITNIILFTNRNLETAEWVNQDSNMKITLKRIADNTFNVKANIKVFNLVYDVEIELLLNMDEDKMMELMSDIKYGWVDKDNNKYNVVNASFSNNYILQSPKQIRENKIGVCWDQVELERYYFDNVQLSYKTYFLCHYDNDKCPTHTFLVYEFENCFYWFEHSWEKYKGVYKYNTLKELLVDVRNKFIKTELNNNYEKNNLLIYEYNKPKYEISVAEFYKHCESGKNININSL